MNTRALLDIAPDPRASGDPAGTDLLRLARDSIKYGLVHGEPLPDPRQFLVVLNAKCGLAEDYW
jgi:hypothetical protein